MSHTALSRHHPHLKYLDHKEIDALYASVFIKGIGDSLISIFTAIYLLHIGFSLSSVGIYYIIFFTVSALASRASMQLGKLWGVKKTLALGIAFLIIYYLLLTLIASGFPYQIVALTYGIGGALYWSAFQLDLARALRSRSAGRTLSLIKIFTILSGIVGPVVGALFIVKSSFAALFLIVSAVLFCSVIPLLRRGDYHIEGAVPSFAESVGWGKPRTAAMYALYGVTESATDILWPVFLYLHYPHILSVGGIVSLTSVLMLGFLYISGRFADKNPLRTFQVGVLSHAPTWIFRLMWLTPGGLLIGNFLGSATSSLVAITVDQTMYHDAKNSDNAAAPLLFRTYYATLGRVAVLLIAVAINNFTALFVMIAILALFQLLGAPKYKTHNIH